MVLEINLSGLLLTFALGSIIGVIIEIIYLTITTKKFRKPGFLKGPYLPIHGVGALMLFLISSLEINLYLKLILLIISPTILELTAGLIFLDYYKIPIWNYSDKPLNYKGIICLEYSIDWAILSLIFYSFLYPIFVEIIKYSSNNIIIILMVVYYLIFSMDLICSVKRNFLRNKLF